MTAEPKENLHESTPIIPQVDTEQSIDENLPSHTADPSALSPPLTRPLKLPFNNLQVDMSAFRENVINIPREDMAAFGEGVPYPTSPTSQQPTSDVEIVLDPSEEIRTVRSSSRRVPKTTFYGVDEQKQTEFYETIDKVSLTLIFFISIFLRPLIVYHITIY